MNIEASPIPQETHSQLHHNNSTIERQNCSRVAIVSPQSNISLTHQQSSLHKATKNKKNAVIFFFF